MLNATQTMPQANQGGDAQQGYDALRALYCGVEDGGFDVAAIVDLWQVFDVLLARCCGTQDAIFDIVAERLNMPGFAAQRRGAQNALAASARPYTIYDVYQTLETGGMPPETARALLTEELRIEREQSIPIRRNLERLERNDMFLADTCLPGPFVEDLLAAAGARNQRPAIAAPGVANEALMPLLQKHYHIRMHHGFGPKPAAFGGEQGTTWEQAEPGDATWESRLVEAGEAQLAALLRECRLRSVPPEGGARHDLVCGPLLTVLLLYALDLGERYPAAPALLFAGGEADQLAAVFRALFPGRRAASLYRHPAPPMLPVRAEAAALPDGVLETGAVLVCLLADTRRAAQLLAQHASMDLLLHTLVAVGKKTGAATSGRVRHDYAETQFDGTPANMAALLQSGHGEVGDVAFESSSGAHVARYVGQKSDAAERRFLEFKKFAVHNLIQALRRRPTDALPSGARRAGLLKQAVAALLQAG